MAPSNRVLLVSFGLNFLLALHLYSSRGARSTSALQSDHEDSRAELAYSGDLSERGNGGAGCTMCGVAPDLCDEVGADLLETAVAFGGTNDRLRRLLAKIQSGQPFSMGVVGGSVSQGTGFKWGDDDDHPREPWYRPTNLHRIIFEHLHALSPLSASDAIPFDIEATGPSGAASGVKAVFDIPGKKEGKNTLVNGAQGGTGSGYFAYCWGEHLEQDVDLFVIELAINDEPLLKNLESYELLVRSLLDQPHKPAVINVEVFALLFETIGFGGDLHKGINQFYNIPSISVRNPFLPQVMADFSQTEMFFQRNKGKKGDAEGLDLRHLSPYGHQKTGDLVNAYIDMQLCEMERHSPLQPGEMSIKHIEAKYPVMDIPKMRLNQQYHPNNIVPKLQPQCYSMKSTKHKLEPLKQEGWRTWSHGEKHYLISTQPGSTISFAFSSALGEVQLHYLRSKIFGLGNLWCWVDDDKDSGERIEAYWKQNFNIAQSTSFSGFKPGQHILHCENEVHTADPGGGHEFRIISLTSI